MRRKSLVIMIIAVSFLLISCKKAETPSTMMVPEQHQKDQLKRSFEESKKVIAAKVNRDPITMFNLIREMNVIAGQYIRDGQQRTPELDSKVRTNALNDLIFQELAIQEAKKRGMIVKPETINSEIDKIRAKAGNENAFQEYLTNSGLTENELKQIIEKDQLFEMIAAKEIDAKIIITDAALRERYKKEKSRMAKDSEHKQMTFEEAKGMLEQSLRTEAGEKRMREWGKELRKNASIEIMAQQEKPM